MKYLMIVLALSFIACKKEDKACYTCSQKIQHYNPGYVSYDTTHYCNKTADEIQQIQDLALKGTVGGKYYLAKLCKKD